MFFFVKAVNPRPSFHLDMTIEERERIAEHVADWSEKARQGIAVVFGPVMDTSKVFGMGVYRVEDEAHMRRLLEQDPAKGLLKYEIFAMATAVLGAVSG